MIIFTSIIYILIRMDVCVCVFVRGAFWNTYTCMRLFAWGAKIELQGWVLRKCLSCLNRIANKPHRPREPEVREILADVGVLWEEAEQQESEENNWEEEDEEEEEECEAEEIDMTHDDEEAEEEVMETDPPLDDEKLEDHPGQVGSQVVEVGKHEEKKGAQFLCTNDNICI